LGASHRENFRVLSLTAITAAGSNDKEAKTNIRIFLE
jgi:hypothetical protein